MKLMSSLAVKQGAWGGGGDFPHELNQSSQVLQKVGKIFQTPYR